MKRTPWFVNGEKPARPGVYNVSCRRERQTGEWYAYWNGKFWAHGFCLDVDDAHDNRSCNRRSGILSETRGSWRGLAEEPRE